MTALDQKTEDAYKAHDLGDLLDHIAWTDVLKPELLKSKAAYARRLTDAVLSRTAEETMKPEQLAGICYGIDMVVGAIEGILRKGISAEDFLRKNGLNLG